MPKTKELAKNKFLHSNFVSGDPFGKPAFFQENRFLRTELMTAHAVDAISVIKIGSFLSLSDTTGGAIIHAHVAIRAITIQNGWTNPDKRFNWCEQELRN